LLITRKRAAIAEVQTDEAVNAINLLFTVLPGVFFASLAVFMLFYKLDNKKLGEIKQELVKQQEKEQPATFVPEIKEQEALA